MSVSKIDPLATVDYLCNTTEHLYLERKGITEKGLKPAKLANEIIGMLNADGGIIALGIADNGAIEDLNECDDKLLLQYEKVCYDLINPPANVRLEKVTMPDGELVFLYHIGSDYENMYSRKDNDAAYVRIGDSNKGPLRNDQIDKLRYDKNLRKYEDQICEDFDPDDIDRGALESYREYLSYDGTGEELLIKRNLASKKNGTTQYKSSAVLLFAQDPDKYIPSAYVRYIRYNGNKAASGGNFNVTKDQRFEGGILSLLSQIQAFIKASLDDFYFLNMENGRFESIAEYPEDAWLEGVVNALVHRSYHLQGNCVYIRHFDDRLEISNSGPLPAQVTVENIRTQRFSRNPRIARVLYDTGYVRELNEGVNRIFNSMEASLLSEPKYTDIDDTVTLILENKVAKHKKTIADGVLDKISDVWGDLNITERQIVQCLMVKSDPTVSELSEYCGVSDRSIRTYLNRFVDGGLVERSSEKLRDKNAKYLLRKRV